MTVISTSNSSGATAYSNQRKVDRCQNGVLWTFYKVGSLLYAAHSTDNGATWTGGYVQRNSTSLTVHEVSIFIDVDDYAHVVFRKQGADATTNWGQTLSDGDVYYIRGTPNAGRTAWTWSAVSMVSGVNGSYGVADIVAHREGTGWAVHIVGTYPAVTSGATNLTKYTRATITSGGTITMGDLFTNPSTTIGGSYSTGNPSYPSIDFNHTGDGKTVAGGTPHLYVAWSAGATGTGKGIRFRKATYSGGTWTWGTEREIDSTRYWGSAVYYWLNCLFDGTRVIIAAALYDNSALDIVLYERDAADTTTTTRILVQNASAADSLFGGSATYDGDGNVYFFGRDDTGAGSGQRQIGYRKWTRATTTFESFVVLDASGNNTPNLSVKRGFSSARIEFIYTDGTSSPYDVTYDAVVLNTAPNAPTQVSPIGGVTVDRTQPITLDWTFSDPDAGDTQSAADVEVRVQGGATVITDSVTTPTEYVIAGNTLAAATHEWRVKTYDSQGEPGPWSGWAPFVAATPPGAPTITDPTLDQTIASETHTVLWSAASQDAYQVRTVADNAGSPDTATVYQDTGTQVSTTARSRTMAFDTNNRTEHVQVRIRLNGLWSTWATVRVNVSYTVPATPTTVPTAVPPSESVSPHVAVSATHPTPTGDQPTVTSMDVIRRELGDTGAGIRIAADIGPTDTYEDHFVGKGIAYEYRVKAYGDNGTSVLSAWV